MGGRRRAEAHTKNLPREDWCTPDEDVLVRVRKVTGGPIDFDPCANPESDVMARHCVMLPKYRDTHSVDCDLGQDCTCQTGHGVVVYGDGLECDWTRFQSTFVNWPYSREGNQVWPEKMYNTAEAVRRAPPYRRTDLFALGPASLSTAWFDYFWEGATSLCIWRAGSGRLRFKGADFKADFESAIAYFGDKHDAFEKAFSDVGRVVPLNRQGRVAYSGPLRKDLM